jgi:hypothetical protein
MNAPAYSMRLDLNVLNHLGLRLYSNVAAVLSEAVANSWDADSPSVVVRINHQAGFIEIVDQGRGMSIDDANSRFLTVGYDKRVVEGAKSPGGRDLMGRKGIGKLALFSIADTVKVASIKNGKLHGFVMSVAGIENAIHHGEEYHPVPIETAELPSLKKGTWIRLEGLKRRASTQTVTALRKRIARRFSVLGPGFRVEVNGHPITLVDREDLSKCQFLWTFDGTSPLEARAIKNVERTSTLDSTVRIDGRIKKVGGWIGSAKKPRDLETDEVGNLNSIPVLARGRLIQENILDRVNVAGLFTKYLTGQIEADFLDLNDEDDIATSDRQRVIEDDPRYQALLAFVRDSLNKIEPAWADWRAELGTKEAITIYPRIADWIAGLPKKSQANATRVIGSIQGLSVDNEEKRRELLRHGLMAFERLRLSESSEQLANMIDARAEDLLPLIGENDQLEAALYLDIIRARLKVITRFTKLVDINAKEKVLQEFIFEHLWLIDPSWERAAGSERMEQRVHKEFKKISAKLNATEKKGRLDIKYRTTAGKHVIIELKRYKVVPSAFDLAKQGGRYRDATTKILKESRRDTEPVEVVFVLGNDTAEHNQEQASRAVAAVNGRIITYEQLIQGAIRAYSEYLEKRKSVDAIETLLEPKKVSSKKQKGRKKTKTK